MKLKRLENVKDGHFGTCLILRNKDEIHELDCGTMTETRHRS